ncbi:MAG: hypothetical protein AAFR04_08535 [Pseudomonadota bacterium]
MRFVYNVITNLVIVTCELLLVALIAAIARYAPIAFAIGTGVLTAMLGLWLERRRLAHELPFYFEEKWSGRTFGVELLALGTALFKGLIAAFITVLTFSGTDAARLDIIALVFAAGVFAGSSLLRRLSISFGASPSRWGFFRLATPLGLIYAQIIALLVVLGVLDQADVLTTLRQAIFDLPERPSIEQASEFLFRIEQLYDAFIQQIVALVIPEGYAMFVSALLSVKVLSGFVIAIYAVIVAEAVRFLEDNS